MDPNLFDTPKREPPQESGPDAPDLPTLHHRYKAILREMLQRSSNIVAFSFAKPGHERIRLDHWPPRKGMSEKALRTLITGGFVRELRQHPGSRAYPRYTLTVLGHRMAES